MADWQASLQQFLDNNPDLPQGEEAVAQESKPSPKPRLDIVLDPKGRAGKSATIISGFTDTTPDDEIDRVARQLKQLLATGGSTRGGEILIQGDRRQDVERHLQAMGYKTRRCN